MLAVAFLLHRIPRQKRTISANSAVFTQVNYFSISTGGNRDHFLQADFPLPILLKGARCGSEV
jgi:hypothetical protein